MMTYLGWTKQFSLFTKDERIVAHTYLQKQNAQHMRDYMLSFQSASTSTRQLYYHKVLGVKVRVFFFIRKWSTENYELLFKIFATQNVGLPVKVFGFNLSSKYGLVNDWLTFSRARDTK